MVTGTTVSSSTTGGVSDAAFEVERHGIDHIPDSERRGRPLDLFWTWCGANVIFTYVIDGAIIVGFGLSFWPALAVILVGNLFYLLVGLCSMPGPRAGTATLAVSRSSFGVLGNLPASVLSWATAVGWEAVNIVIGALSLYQILQQAGGGSGIGWKALSLVLVVCATFGVAVLGHAAITWLNRLFSYVLGLGTLVLGVLVMPHLNLHAAPALGAPTRTGAFLLALVVMAAAPISWVNSGSDYSRYLPRATSAKQIVIWTAFGGAVPAVLISIIGAAAASATDMTDPVAGLQKLLPGWFFVPYLAVIVGGTITNNFLNTYSSGMYLLTSGLKVKRYQAVLIDAAVGTALAVYALFVFDFTNSFIQFLSLTVIWLAPWCGIYLADLLLRRGNYDPAGLHQRGGGAYWYTRGWNIRALLWFVLGIAGAAAFSNSALFKGPLVGLTGGGDLSIFVGLLIGFGGYYASMRRTLDAGGQRASSDLLPDEATTQPALDAAGSRQ